MLAPSSIDGHFMGTAASSFVSPIAVEPEDLISRPGAQALARRAMQRRQIQVMIAASYLVDALVLLIYARAGTVPLSVGPAYAATGLTFVMMCIAVSERGFNERFKDHYLVAPQSVASMAIMIAFAYVAPEVGVMFLCTLFVVFAFSSLRSTPRETAVIWTAMSLSLAGLFLLTDKPISMPHGNYLERLATMLVFILTIGRCMFIGIFSSSMKQSLYQRGIKLKEAYKRIEELAELDELTGTSNRRCIMRMLDEEIDRARRTGAPCSIALIDLDWFKRINDAFGHPTGDEVLRTFAVTVFANIRPVDRFGRYGGEEFLLVLPDAPQDGACRLLDRLRAIVADLDWSAFAPEMRVTISAGVATLRVDEKPDTFLARADSALYIAKAQGRNRIASA
jgi:diguanylate cyclase